MPLKTVYLFYILPSFLALLSACHDFSHPEIGREYYSPRGGNVILLHNNKEMTLKGDSLIMKGTYSIKKKELRFNFEVEGKKGFLLFFLKPNKIISEDKKFIFYLIPLGSREKHEKASKMLSEIYHGVLKKYPQGIPKKEIKLLPLVLQDIKTGDYHWKVCVPPEPCNIPQFPKLKKISMDKCKLGCFLILLFSNLDRDYRLDIWVTAHNIKKLPNNRPYLLYGDLSNWENEILIQRLF